VEGEGVLELLKKGVNPAKHSVCGFVFAPEIPPALNDSLVIAVYLKVSARASKPGDCPDEELEANRFCPSDVSRSIEGLPPGMRRQALHLPWTEMAMPKPELASEKASVSRRSRGVGMGLEMLRESLPLHQERSSERPFAGK
jgi:hypothetical protein